MLAPLTTAANGRVQRGTDGRLLHRYYDNGAVKSTGSGFQPAMVAAAKKHPDVKFEMATGTAESKNMAEYFGAGEDGIYLSGMAAGAGGVYSTVHDRGKRCQRVPSRVP